MNRLVERVVSEQREREEKKKEDGLVSNIWPVIPSREVLGRAATRDTIFFCKVCKDVVLHGDASSHNCGENGEKVDNGFFNTHCAVEDAVTKIKCIRGLNCKTHSIHAKRAVMCREAPFDLLLKKSTEERKKKKTEKQEEKSETADAQEYSKLEEAVCASILQHPPIIERGFFLPEIKFDTLATRSIFFQPLKTQRLLNDKRLYRKGN